MIAGSETAAGLLMPGAMLLQMPGALLKREALHARVGANPGFFSKALKSAAAIGWLLFLYWLLMMFVAFSAVLALPFVMFCIAPGLLFFVEDARARGTWIRFGVIDLFAAYHMFYV